MTDEELVARRATDLTMHPFTCQDSAHGPLIATCDGWICRNLDCDYTQDWAHSFMANGQAVAAHKTFIAALDVRPSRKEC